jgi:hypothetical protein
MFTEPQNPESFGVPLERQPEALACLTPIFILTQSSHPARWENLPLAATVANQFRGDENFLESVIVSVECYLLRPLIFVIDTPE